MKMYLLLFLSAGLWLAGCTTTPETPAASPAAPAEPAAERARVKAIARAADEDQEALADKLIADGVPEADALKALAADRAAKKPKAPKPAKGDADKPATPQA